MPGSASLAAAITIYFLPGALLVVPGIKSGGLELRAVFGWLDDALELVTRTLGVLTAILSLPPPSSLSSWCRCCPYSSAVRWPDLETLAVTDAKTGVT